MVIIGFAGILAAYRGVRRGGARFYTLEREAMLRRASFTLLISTALLLGAVGLLIYQRQQIVEPGTAEPGETETGVATTATPESVLETFPPTGTPTSTADPNIPTATPTPIICRAVVDGTAGSGLTLRDAPGGTEIAILPDGSILTLLEAEPVTANGYTWRQVRTVAREEGWVVEEFLTIGDCR